MTTTTLPASLAEATDDDIREIVSQAHLPSLLATLAYLTGDYSLLRDDLLPSTVTLNLRMDPSGGLSPEAQAIARELAAGAIARFRDSGMREAGHPGPEQLKDLMSYIAGSRVGDEYLPLLNYELDIADEEEAPHWTKAEVAPDRDFSVIVIGAGMSGIAAAHRLTQTGIPFVVIERNDEVGGVWLENGYPGARLDTSNFTYSYSFAQEVNWEEQYSRRDAILGYFKSIADRFDLRRYIRFNTTVNEAVFNEADGTWTLTITKPDGSQEQLTANVIISAVGQLNNPNIPDIPGLETFEGATWHTARWDHSVDLAGKRVAVIGTGASAFQVIPQVAKVASHLTVFQRTPAWVIPTPGYNRLLSPRLRWLFENLPHYNRWYRFAQFWVNVDGIRHLAVVDPSWSHEVSISPSNEKMRQELVRFLEESFADRPDILSQIVPSYPPYAKRTVRDDGTWINTLKMDTVSVTSEKIAEITPKGIRTADGILHEVDVIIYGTGFKATDFLSTMTVRGRGGETLTQHWAGDSRAFYGSAITDFPNLFCIYGPNTNLNVNGSTVLFSEAAANLAIECIHTILATGSKTMEIRDVPFDAFNERIDAASLQLASGVSTVSSWYKNAFGRVSQNWPLTTLEYWEGTRGPELADYELRK